MLCVYFLFLFLSSGIGGSVAGIGIFFLDFQIRRRMKFFIRKKITFVIDFNAWMEYSVLGFVFTVSTGC